MDRETKLTELKGVGPALAERLRQTGLINVGDLLEYYPFRYEDLRHATPTNQVADKQLAVVSGRLISIENKRTRRFNVTEGLIEDEAGQLAVVWYNQPYLVNQLRPNSRWIFYGRVQRQQGRVVLLSPRIETTNRIIPIYHGVEGLTARMVEKLVEQVLSIVASEPDWLDGNLRQRFGLIDRTLAISQIHRPSTMEDLEAARYRLGFDELFTLIWQVRLARRLVDKQKANSCPPDINRLKNFTATLPFRLTDSQRIAIWQIVNDIGNDQPMNRLLIGDVGSGKTVVGAAAALCIAKHRLQTVWLAPTTILAGQHFATCQRLLSPHSVRSLLLTSQTAKHATKELDQADLIIATHAALGDKVRFERLGLIIVDEQHRFGVNQRRALLERPTDAPIPHFLSMTATPIPRTLALSVYGDLDISQLTEMPTGRRPVISRLVHPNNRPQAEMLIERQIAEGHRVFVVCPLISPSEAKSSTPTLFALTEKRTVEAESQRLHERFPHRRIGVLHGKLKPEIKEEIIGRFATGEIDILVSTTVIEVGIDIPEATVMVVESAEQFGLAQLHQLRGRVGRSSHQSYCLLFTTSVDSAAVERLSRFTSTTSGLELAELDLTLRGPGQLTGLAQSGLSGLKIARLTDIHLMTVARTAVDELADTTMVDNPLLRQLIERNRLAIVD